MKRNRRSRYGAINHEYPFPHEEDNRAGAAVLCIPASATITTTADTSTATAKAIAGRDGADRYGV